MIVVAREQMWAWVSLDILLILGCSSVMKWTSKALTIVFHHFGRLSDRKIYLVLKVSQVKQGMAVNREEYNDIALLNWMDNQSTEWYSNVRHVAFLSEGCRYGCGGVVKAFAENKSFGKNNSLPWYLSTTECLVFLLKGAGNSGPWPSQTYQCSGQYSQCLLIYVGDGLEASLFYLVFLISWYIYKNSC